LTRGIKLFQCFFCESERILWKEFWPVAKSTFQKTSPWSVYQSICMKKNKNICPWLVNWNVQYSAGLWNVSGGRLQFLGMSTDKMFTQCKFQYKDKWQTIRKHQYIMWQRPVWDLEFNRREYFKNILKYFWREFETS